MNPKQFEAVVALDGPKRYAHFVGKIGDWQELWSLKSNDGFVGVADDQSRRCIPFWPHPDFATDLATDSWKECVPERIELNSFLEAWLPRMKKDGVFAAVFPTKKGKGVVVDPMELKKHLTAEIAQYE